MSTRRAAVLVGTDGSPSADRAIGWAADEAARSGRELRILHVLETPTKTAPGKTAGDTDALVDSWTPVLRGAQDLALRRQPDLKVETMLVHDRDIAAGLRQYAGEATEVVIGHRGRGGFAELLLGSTALHLAGHFPGPVVVVRGRDDGTAGEIVAGVDLVEDPAPALDHAFAAASARGARVRALHAWRPAPLAYEAGVDLERTSDVYRGQLASILVSWRERYPGVEVIEDVVIGHPVEALVLASAKADLVVVGSRGRTLPLGSVSHGAIHHARCPVAVVRSYD